MWWHGPKQAAVVAAATVAVAQGQFPWPWSPTRAPTPRGDITAPPLEWYTPQPTLAPTLPPSPVIQTPEPTKLPTPEPTLKPTPLPTGNPTTDNPTRSPTKEPTNAPTPEPSKSPEVAPTEEPTRRPTPRPSNFPTSSPIPSPTLSPTENPTQAPVPEPTAQPTTATPTITRTVEPTRAPSEAPSLRPTIGPTQGPTQAPTSGPTRSPTYLPSKAPTQVTAGQASTGPTSSPTTKQQGILAGGQLPVMAMPTLSYISLSLAVLTTLTGLSAAAFSVAYRKRPIMQLSQQVFLLLFSLCVAVIGVSLFPLVVGGFRPSVGLCVVHDWIFHIALCCAMASLFVKEWRSYVLYKSTKTCKRVTLPNSVLFKYIAILMVVPVGLLAAHSAHELVPDGNDEWRCPNGVPTVILFIYEVLLAVGMVTMAVIARAVPSVGGESTGILFSSVFITFTMVFVGLVFVLGSTKALSFSYEVEILLVCFAVFWCAIIALGFIVFRKLMWINASQEAVHGMFLRPSSYSRTSSKSASTHEGRTSDTRDAEGFTKNHISEYTDDSWSIREESPSNASIYSRNTASVPKVHMTQEGSSTAQSAPPSSPAAFYQARAAQQQPTGPASAAFFARAEPVPAQTKTSGAGDTQAPALPPKPRSLSQSGTEPPEVAQGQSATGPSPEVQAKIENSFLVGSGDGWDEYVDRTTGDSWKLNLETFEVTVDSVGLV